MAKYSVTIEITDEGALNIDSNVNRLATSHMIVQAQKALIEQILEQEEAMLKEAMEMEPTVEPQNEIVPE